AERQRIPAGDLVNPHHVPSADDGVEDSAPVQKRPAFADGERVSHTSREHMRAIVTAAGTLLSPVQINTAGGVGNALAVGIEGLHREPPGVQLLDPDGTAIEHAVS